MRALSLTLAACLVATSAYAEPVPDSAVPVARRSGPLPTAAAVVPGLLVHGTGHYALRQPRTARRLLLMEGIGLGRAGTSFFQRAAADSRSRPRTA